MKPRENTSQNWFDGSIATPRRRDARRLRRDFVNASRNLRSGLAVAGTPMVVAYRMDAVAWSLRFLMQAPSIVLANLVLGENAFPEFLQDLNSPTLFALLMLVVGSLQTCSWLMCCQKR